MEHAASPAPDRHLVICGTGRAGTTALVRLLDRCGQDARLDELRYFPDARAGLEWDTERWPEAGCNPPRVIKSPQLSLRLREAIGRGLDPRSIEAILLPLRDLDQAVASRVARFAGERPWSAALGVRGGLFGSHRPSHQRWVLSAAVHELLATAAEHDIPVISLHYPRFVSDACYTWGRLQPVLPGLEEPAFRTAFAEVIQPDLTTSYRPYRRRSLLMLDARWAMIRLLQPVARRLRLAEPEPPLSPR